MHAKWLTATLASAALLGGATLIPGSAQAAGSVQWLAPPDGSTYLVGTNVKPDGNADGFGQPGTGLDLMLVLDASGSMTIINTAGGVTKTRLAWQADAAKALVNSLPATNTSVGVVQYETNASLRLPLTSTANTATINAAIDAVPATGWTGTGLGIELAQAQFALDGTPGRVKQMVVISDGDPNRPLPAASAQQYAVDAAAAAKAAGITVHGVVIPGGNAANMEAIANAGGGKFANFSNPADLADIEAFFSGAAGSFVGVDQVDLELPDGTILTNVATDAFGNFHLPSDWTMLLGDNVFTATAFFEDGSEATAQLTLVGVADPAEVPVPATAWLLLGGLAMVGWMRRRSL